MPVDRTKDQVSNIIKWLSKMKLHGEKLSQFDEKELELLGSNMEAVDFQANSLIFLQGDKGDYYYWVIGGAVDLYTAFTMHDEFKLREKHTAREQKASSSVVVVSAAARKPATLLVSFCASPLVQIFKYLKPPNAKSS